MQDATQNATGDATQATPDAAELVDALSARADALRDSGALRADVAALTQRVARLCVQKAWPEASDAYAQLAALAAQEEDRASEALALYGQAVALFHVPDGAEGARAALLRAVPLADAVGHHTLGAKAQHLLSAIALDADDMSAALVHETAALERLDEDAEPALAVDIYRSRATLHWLRADPARAGADLETALRIARRVPDKGVALSLRADQKVLEALSSPEGLNTRPFDALFEQARRRGKADVMGDAALFQAAGALRAGQYKRALARAEVARANALRATDAQRVMRYFAACVLLASARDVLGDRRGVLEVLLTCKATLEREIGKPAGELARAFLDLLPQHWGAERFQEALGAYRLWVKERAAS